MTTLTSYWIEFPADPSFPHGFGVTGRNLADAYALLEANGYDFHRHAKEVKVREGVTPSVIDAKHVAPNSGPHIVRGVWYPAYNVGFGAPGHVR
jgi:hypothetical protein